MAKKPPGDSEIIALFFARDERAIALTEEKHGGMIYGICRSILQNHEDAEECCNSVYFSAWSKIPPEEPRCLPAFLSFLARTCAIDRYRSKTRRKRAGESQRAPFEELENLLSSDSSPQGQLENKELSAILNDFLGALPREDRRLFIRRYYFEESVDKIASDRGVSRRTLYARLSEIKKKLETILRREGYLP